jgi:hypothetical protein
LTATARPSAARRRAIAAPKPRELPVTSATRWGVIPALCAARRAGADQPQTPSAITQAVVLAYEAGPVRPGET